MNPSLTELDNSEENEEQRKQSKLMAAIRKRGFEEGKAGERARILQMLLKYKCGEHKKLRALLEGEAIVVVDENDVGHEVKLAGIKRTTYRGEKST